MAETNLELYQRWFEEVWNQRKEETIDELTTSATKGYGLGTEPVVGPNEFKVFWKALLTAFEDLHVQLEHTISSGDYVAGHLTVTGRHVGDGLGCPPSGKRVTLSAHVFARWIDGKIDEAWNLLDMATLYRQAGML